jgi:hypothetical protein
MSFLQFLPRRLRTNYKSIMTSDLVENKVLNETNLKAFQTLLNEAQPYSDDESVIQKTIQFLYRQNVTSFYKFLIKNKMNHVVLWTESKCIVMHLGLQGLVYISWNKEKRVYEVYLHKNIINRQTQEDKDKTQVHKSIDRIVSEVAGSEVVGSEVVGSEVVGSEVVGSEVVGSEVVGSEVAEQLSWSMIVKNQG